MPSIAFSPVVGERVVVCAGDEESSSVRTLHFTATFPSQQAYDEFRRDRVRVELWTNIPSAENKHTGHWVALPFREKESITSDDGAFSLLPEGPNVKTLHLELPVPLSGNSFSFTHRLSYPSGEIRWLGHYRQDGQLVIERGDPRFTRGTFINKDGETVAAGAGGWVDKEIAQLSKNFDWSIHAIQEDGSSAVHVLDGRALSIQAPVIFCVPVVRARSIVIPQTFSLAASANSTFSINTFGSVLMTGPANCSVSFHSYAAETRGDLHLTAIRKALSYGGLPRGQVLNFGTGASHAILATKEGISPAIVSVLPLITPGPSSSPRSVGVTLQSLATLAPQDISDLTLFCPSTMQSRFLAVPSDKNSNEDVTLQAGPECSQFVVAPAYDLRTGDSSSWKVSITTSHTPATPTSHSLPTPPLSPIRTALPLPEVVPQAVSETEVAVNEVSAPTEAPQPVARVSSPVSAPSIPFIPSMIVLRLLLVKLWLLRVLLYFSAQRLPRKEVEEPVKAQKVLIEAPEVHADEDEGDEETVAPSVSSAADVGTVAYLDDEDLKGSVSEAPALLFDVAAGNVSMLVRPAVASGSISADTLKIDLDGVPVKRAVRPLNGGAYLLEFSAGSAGGRVSVMSA